MAKNRWKNTTEQDALDALREAEQARRRAGRERDAAAIVALLNGNSYAEVADMLGVTRQAAWELFHERHAEGQREVARVVAAEKRATSSKRPARARTSRA